MATTKLFATASLEASKATKNVLGAGEKNTSYHTYASRLIYGGYNTTTGTGPENYIQWYGDYVGVVWIGGYDASQLDNFSVTSFVLRLKASDTTAPAGTKITLPTTTITPASDGQTVINAVKSGVVLYTLPSTVSAGGDILITITNKTTMKRILNGGIGIYKAQWQEYHMYDEADGANAPYVEFVYTDTDAPHVVNVTYPVSATIVESASNTFTWSYYQEASQAQSHFDLQYSNDNGATWTTQANKVASATASRVITANTFSSGVYLWRVRAWTKSGTVVGDWSTTSIIAQVNPVTTGVTCDGKPKPKTSWTASEQQAFQIKMGNYDTGTIYSAAASYALPMYFNDNAYPLTMRTQNNLGVWSAWTETIYAPITNTSGAEIVLSSWQAGYAVGLEWSTTGTYTAYYVYRNGIPIAKVTGKTYTDHLAIGNNEYKIRGILATGYYTLSNISTETVNLPFDMVSDISSISWKYLKYASGGPVSRNYNLSDNVSYLRFNGRAYPVSVHDGQKSYKGSFAYSFTNHAEVETLKALIGKTVIYKDRRGNRIIGIMNEAPYNVSRIHDIAFTITATDYSEAVSYD